MTASRPGVDVEKMRSMRWFHKIDLGPGVVTPGYDWEDLWSPTSRFLDGVDFRGKRVMEIGCWDGMWSFDAERRGAAEVVATDNVSQRWGSEETFRFARSALESKAIYLPNVDIYTLDQLDRGLFDIVLCLGVLYHLRYPFYAIARLRNLLNPGGVLVLETAAVNDTEESYMLYLYENRNFTKDRSFWCAPTLRCLRESLESSYFAVDRMSPAAPEQTWRRRLGRTLGIRRPADKVRVAVQATAVIREDGHHAYPDWIVAGHDPRFVQGADWSVESRA